MSEPQNIHGPAPSYIWKEAHDEREIANIE